MIGVFEKKISDELCSVTLFNGSEEINSKDIIPAKAPLYKKNQLVELYEEKIPRWIPAEVLVVEENFY